MLVSFRALFIAVTREAVPILLGAASMRLFTSLVFDTHMPSHDPQSNVSPALLYTGHLPLPPSITPNLGREMPHTELVSHAPG